MATWSDICSFARGLPDAVIEHDTIRTPEGVAVRRLDPRTVAFAVADTAARDALIQGAPSLFFTTTRLTGVDVVLALLALLDDETIRDRLHAAWLAHGRVVFGSHPSRADAAEASPAGPRLYMLLYVKDLHKEPESKNERRTFRKVGRSQLDEQVARWWQAFRAGKAWGAKLARRVYTDLEVAFERLREEFVECPEDLAEATTALAKHLELAPHVLHCEGDDDEGLEWEFWIFDENYLGDEASDYLPHPDRGERRSHRDDGYRALLRKHHKFMHALGSSPA